MRSAPGATISEFAGTPVVVENFATWCSNCLRQLGDTQDAAAQAGSDAVFHDADGDRPPERFAPLSTTVVTRVGPVELIPLRTDPEQGLYVHRVTGPGG